MMRFLIFIALTLIPLSASESFCDVLDETPLPFHGNDPPSNSPFSVVTSASTAHQSEMLTIRIESFLSEHNVGGLVIHARSTSQPFEVLGRFINSSSSVKLSNCHGEDSVATYVAQSDFDGAIGLQWRAPNNYLGEVTFIATIATRVLQEYDKSWVGITSKPVEIIQSDDVKFLSYLISSAIRPNSSNIASQPLEPRVTDLIYEGCGSAKTCFGIPANCVASRSCQAVVTAVGIGGRYQFEIESNAGFESYVAVGLSSDDRMGDDSVIECIRDDGGITAFTSYNTPRPNIGNSRDSVPQSIFTLLNSSFVNGRIYCKLEREAITTVRGIEFDLTNEDFHFMLALGDAVQSSVITRHVSRIVSAQPLHIIQSDPIYEGCGTAKTCFGMPANCVEQRSCQALATAVVVANRYQFELKSSVDGVGYVSLALSRDHLMGEDSVMECIQEDGVVRAYTSWNNRRSNTRAAVPQNIITLLNSSFVNGTIYCKLEREAETIVLETEFNLLIEDFYFLVAIGRNFNPTSIGMHDLSRLSSEGPLEIIGEQQDSIYDGCGTTKTCVGMPIGCELDESCRAIVTVAIVNDRYEFEMESGVAGVRYVSFGLSRDEYMGEDSVIECTADEENINAYHSWNTPLYTNTRVGVSQTVIRLLNSSYIDGNIYCKVERDYSTDVLGSRFDLDREHFYFLLAIGSNFSANAILMHDLGRIASTEPIYLPITDSATQISAFSIVLWLLASSCALSLRGL